MAGVSKFLLKAVLGFAVVVGIIAGVMRLFFITPVTITHQGMAPTLFAGERVYMWRDRVPELGDIAVCAHPQNPEVVIGRVIGRAGNRIEVERGALKVSGSSPNRDVMESLDFFNTDFGRSTPVTRVSVEFGNTTHDVFESDRELRFQTTEVPSGSLYLMGDNRTDPSHDSRSFGPVAESSCLGTLFMRGAPVDAGLGLGHSWLDLL